VVENGRSSPISRKIGGLTVVARNSAFTYKNSAVKIPDVRYALEGTRPDDRRSGAYHSASTFLCRGWPARGWGP